MTPLAPSRSRTPFCTLMDCHLGPLRRRRRRRLTTCTGPPLQRGLSSLWRKSYRLMVSTCAKNCQDGTHNLRCLILFQNMELSLQQCNALQHVGKNGCIPNMHHGPGSTRSDKSNALERPLILRVGLVLYRDRPLKSPQMNGQQSILLTVSLKMFHCHKTIRLFLSHEGWQDDNWW